MPKKISLLILGLFYIGVCLTCTNITGQKPDLKNCPSTAQIPEIYPDYTNTTLPPNIAPLNFVVREKGDAYFVQISAEQGKAIEIAGRSPEIEIPVRAWQNLLAQNPAQELQITVYVKTQPDQWLRFAPIKNRIAGKAIDTHLVYRIIPPLYQYYDKMTIYERNLTNFDVRPILYNKSMGNNCVNCHYFHNHNPDRMMYHLRAGEVGTTMILVNDGKISKINTKTTFNPATAYRSWHPNGKIIAFSCNVVKQMFHSIGENRDVYDRASDVLLYNIETNTITTTPKIATKERMETYPEWSADGKYIYFCSAPAIESFDPREHPYNKLKYDLMRIAYDVQNDAWGEVEPVVLASALDSSIAHPKVSPDGRYLLFCMTEFSNFPLYNTDSDLYLLDIQTGKYWKPQHINSNRAESYHCWSANGHWVVFSSKREDNLCTHLFISFFDGQGNFSKPFILPQKDPVIYQTLFEVYNVPELVNGPIRVRPQKLIEAAWSKKSIQAKLDPKLEVKQKPQSEDLMYQPVFN